MPSSLKKIPEANAIFDNLIKINDDLDLREDSLRISIDTKTKVDLCDSSCGGISRCQKAVQASIKTVQRGTIPHRAFGTLAPSDC